MALSVPRILIAAAALAVLAPPALAQRPALAGEKAQVADAVKADLARLHDLQQTHHSRARVYAADARDLNFTPTSGAQINIAYASANAWAANATHPVLSPIACFIIISSAEPTGPASEPFCQEGRPGSTVATAPAQQAAPTQQAPATTTPRTQPQASQPPAGGAGAAQQASTPPTSGAAPATPLPRSGAAAAGAPPSSVPARTEQVMSPAQPAPRLRQPGGTPVEPVTGGPAGSAPAGVVMGADPLLIGRAGTREVDVSGAITSQQVENVTAQQFSQKLNEFAQGANAIFMTQPAEIVRITRDPYESTEEFEARRAAAIAAAQRREREFFQQNNKTYNVALPIREVRYDADREVLEFSVDGIGLPITRTYGDESGTPTLTFTCYTRPVFWCSPETGMTYDAGDLWRIPRETARQFDVLRTPLTLYARFAVGRREDTRTLSISLLSMDLQARNQSVQRWEGGSR